MCLLRGPRGYPISSVGLTFWAGNMKMSQDECIVQATSWSLVCPASQSVSTWPVCAHSVSHQGLSGVHLWWWGGEYSQERRWGGDLKWRHGDKMGRNLLSEVLQYGLQPLSVVTSIGVLESSRACRTVTSLYKSSLSFLVKVVCVPPSFLLLKDGTCLYLYYCWPLKWNSIMLFFLSPNYTLCFNSHCTCPLMGFQIKWSNISVL